jgi:hypothetical protein
MKFVSLENQNVIIIDINLGLMIFRHPLCKEITNLSLLVSFVHNQYISIRMYASKRSTWIEGLINTS